MHGAVAHQWRRLNRHLGYQGRALFFLAAMCFYVGARLLEGDWDVAHTYPIEFLPLWLRVAVWWVPAVVAGIVSFWPPGFARWGYAALMVPIALRGFSYLTAAAFWLLEKPFPQVDVLGESGAVWPALFWLGTTAFVGLLAGWPEPVDVQHGEAEWHGGRQSSPRAEER